MRHPPRARCHNLAAMTQNVNEAPDPDSREFFEGRNTVEKLSPGTTADAPATDAGLISTDPTPSSGEPG